jgi:hypothetical protein
MAGLSFRGMPFVVQALPDKSLQIVLALDVHQQLFGLGVSELVDEARHSTPITATAVAPASDA